MRKYSEYKDSGVKWIGDIPKHWEVTRGKNILNLITERSQSEVKVGLENIEGFTGQYIETATKYDGEGVQVRVGDIVYGKLRPYLCKAWLATFECNAVGDFYVFRCKNNNYTRYIHQLFLSHGFTDITNASTYGARMPRVASSFIQSLSFPIPPLAEQRAIVSYLDGKVGQIDTYVAKQTQQIELLKELKQAVIANAVTKGIDNKAKLKQTGISWIGHVPQHWEQCRLKNVVSCNNETLSNNTEPSLQIEYVEIADVKEMEGIVRTTHYKFSEAPSRARRITKNGDIILSTVRTYLKAVALVKQEGLIVSTGFAVLRPKDCNQEYISYLLRSDYFLGEVSRRSFGISYPSITTDALLSIEIPIPPLSEQRAIVSYIESKTVSINKLIDAYEQQVERVKEYKQRLISDAVMGKMNVTDEQTQTN